MISIQYPNRDSFIKPYKEILFIFNYTRRIKMAEVSKENQEKAYEAVEIAKKTGKLKKGVNEVTKCVEKGQAKLVVIADDVNPKEILMHLPLLCEEKKIPCISVGSKEELGVAAGLGLATSTVAIIQEGESRHLIKELSPK